MKYVIYNDVGEVRKFLSSSDKQGSLWTSYWSAAMTFDGTLQARWYVVEINKEFQDTNMKLKIGPSYNYARSQIESMHQL